MMGRKILKPVAVISVALLVGSMAPATVSAQESPVATLSVWAILAMITGSLLLVGSVAASVDAADCVPGESLEVLVSGHGIQVPDLPPEVQAMLPTCDVDRPALPQPEPAPAPGPVDPNGRG
ncbi:MAG TPA: hypothetical protein GX694_13230 [Actinomycetales bacterium]|nr:hypothetical protein [Actinomycetales bacterium]